VEILPPTVSEPHLLALVGRILAAQGSSESTAALRRQLWAPAFSWQALTAVADAQGVLIPLIHALRRQVLLPPVPRGLDAARRAEFVTESLERAWRDHAARREDMSAQLSAILAALNGAGIVPLLLKGARFLLGPDDTWRQARTMRDIDILVPRPAAAQAMQLLSCLGYRARGQEEVTDQHLPELVFEGRAGAVEVHIEALGFRGRRILPTERLTALASPASFRGRQCLVLPPEWQLLVGLLHHQASDDGHRQETLALKGLWEFAMLGDELADAGWRAIGAHMAEAGAADMLGSWLMQAQTLFGLRPPAGVAISRSARAHAQSTLQRAALPYWRRRMGFVARQLRNGFSAEAIAVRYGLRSGEVGIAHRVRHGGFLMRRYRSRALQRLLGRADRVS
jgi:hypothetical protein